MSEEQNWMAPESPYQKLATEMAGMLLVNSLSTVRQSIGTRAGLTHGGLRDIYSSCGYPLELTVYDYYQRWRRGDVARPVIDAYPKACWQEAPEVWDNEEEAVPEEVSPEDSDPGTLYQSELGAEGETVVKTNAVPPKTTAPEPVERKPGVNVPPLPAPKKPVVRGKGKQEKPDTPFMTQFKTLAKRVKLWHYMQKVDTLAGIGRYGVLYLGFDDTSDVSLEVTPGAKLLYVQAFREDCASISGLVGEVTDRRYGLPVGYNLRTAQGIDNANATRGAYPMSAQPGAGQPGLTLQNVHWSRCIHVVEDADDGELYGTPRLEAVWNRLQDIETAVSASGETFWRSGFQRVFAKIDPGEGVVMSTAARAKLETKLDEMMMGLKDHIVGQGLDMKTLTGQTADPTKIVDTCLKLIGATKRIPYRLLTGSEQGELAGSQDGDNFKANTNGRRNGYCVNGIVRPFVDRLLAYNVIPAPESGEYDVEWKGAEEQKPEVKAQVLTSRVTAITSYLSGGGDQLVPRKAFLTDEMDIDPDVAEQYLDEADEAVALAEEQSRLEMETAMQAMPGETPPGQPGKAPPFGKKPNPFQKVNMAVGQPRDEEGKWTSNGIVDIDKQAAYIKGHVAGKMKAFGWTEEKDGRATKRFPHLAEAGTIVRDGGRVLTATIERGRPVIKAGDEYVAFADQGWDSQSQAVNLNRAAEAYVSQRQALFKNNAFSEDNATGGLQGQGDTPWWKRISEFLRTINPLKRNVEGDDPPNGTPVEVELEGGVTVNACISGRNGDNELTATGDDGSVYTLPE